MWRVRFHFFLNQLQTVHMQALLSDMFYVCRAACIWLNLPLRLARVGCILQ